MPLIQDATRIVIESATRKRLAGGCERAGSRRPLVFTDAGGAMLAALT